MLGTHHTVNVNLCYSANITQKRKQIQGEHTQTVIIHTPTILVKEEFPK